jgi:C4-dicarboxylate-binding protein DctP
LKPSILPILQVFLAMAPITARTQESTPILCRISTENSPGHFQVRALRRFSELVAERSAGTLKVEFYDSGSLYRDSNAVSAIGRGDLEIAAPGIWQLDKLVPDSAALMLPMMYAKPVEVHRAVVDGPVGKILSRDVGEAMKAEVLGPWLDLGFGHIFATAKPIRSIAGIQGRRIRVAGGRGNEERVRALGGIPVTIPLLDLPAYLKRGLVDGVLTTYETVATAGLDAAGIKSVLEDAQYYPFYVPVASASFWGRIDSKTRSMLRDSWLEVVTQAREESVRAQAEAKRALVKRGMKVYAPSSHESSKSRMALLAGEEEMAKRLNVSDEVLALLRLELEKAKKR